MFQTKFNKQTKEFVLLVFSNINIIDSATSKVDAVLFDNQLFTKNDEKLYCESLFFWNTKNIHCYLFDYAL